MRAKKFYITFLAAVILFASIPVSGAISVSPALDIIAAAQTMSKCTSDEGAITFCTGDFDELLGCEVTAVTVTKLPEATAGKLLLGVTPVMKGQTVSRDYLDKLSFMPGNVGPAESGFSFTAETANGIYSMACTLYVIDKENTAPTSAGLSENAFTSEVKCNIDSYGSLKAWDAEGNDISYKITSQPKNGKLILTDASSGAYRYTPEEDFTGKDSFSYTACDKYGAVSDEMIVYIEIKESESGIFYSDLGSHWAHSSAIELTDTGVMSGTVKSGMRFFEPDKTMTASEFTAAAMKAIGYRLDDVVGAETVFWDNGDIPEEDIAYVAEAARLGYIDGEENENGKLCFYPNKTLSRAEAAVMICRFLESEEPIYRAVFADETSVPAWAQDAIYTMNSLGIMCGTGGGNIDANSPITRAEAAVMLDRMTDIYGAE